MDSDAPLIICWGEVLWDLFPDGRQLGGAPANVAYHLAVTDRRTALVSRVGDDELGAEAVQALARAGVDTIGIQIDPVRATGVVGVEVVNGDARYTLYPDRAWELIELTAEGRGLLAEAAALCYGTFSLRTQQGRESLEAAIAAMPTASLRICDPNFRPGRVDLDVVRTALGWADVVKINDQEARDLEALYGARDAVSWLMNELGVGVVAVTRGARGSAIHRGTESVDHPGFEVAKVDSVGCGDAYTAVLAAMLVEERPLAEINEEANRYASYVATRRGATPPRQS